MTASDQLQPGSVRLDIFADPVCPWCLIGKARLDRALAARPDHPFLLIWHPFRLNPVFPRDGVPMDEYLRVKLGDNVAGMLGEVARQADALGITLNPPKREPSTTDAHRLMHWAGLESAQTLVMEGLLAAHWREGRDISDSETLAEIGENAGMDGAMIRRLLASDADHDWINSAETHARQRGVTSVPTFIVADQHVVTGAQPTDLWTNVIDELMGRDPGAA